MSATVGVVHGACAATLVRCVRCNAALISVGRFMDQGSSQGTPRALDSEILIEVDDESTIEGTIDEAVDIAQSSIVQDEVDDELQLIEESAAEIDLDALHQEELAKDTEENVDAYGEPDDYSNEYITVSHQSSTEPPALCRNTEEISKVFD